MRNSRFTRRDILKLFGIAGVNWFVSSIFNKSKTNTDPTQLPANVIIVLLDALSARDMSLYGYQRKTTPNINQFAEISTVFHQHHAAANFTTPNTASLLTGTYPWTHRAIQLLGTTSDLFKDANIFSEITSSQYQTVTYTHNINTSILLDQFRAHISQLIPIEELTLYDPNKLSYLLDNDYQIGFLATRKWRMVSTEQGNSVFISPILDQINRSKKASINSNYKASFPAGVCENWEERLFLLEDAIDWINQKSMAMDRPFLGYFHLLPPHDPHRPSKEFYNYFQSDQFQPIMKPSHFAATHSTEEIIERRQQYDDFIAYCDTEIGRLLDLLNQAGILDTSYLVITSDHGELFERGILGHVNPTLYEPLLHIPLIIHAPGQTQRQDVQTPTSILDIMPTLLHLSGRDIPSWCEGQILPGLGGNDDPQRSIFAVEAKENPKFAPIKKGTLSIIRWPYKLIHYRGYQDFDDISELYDLENDPEELDDLAQSKATLVAELKNELNQQLLAAEQKLEHR